jgi:hypothetical protein
MIHTDGTPTIANHPGYSVKVDEADPNTDYLVALEGTASLLERNYAGLTVEVRWVEGTEHLLLCVAKGDERYAAVIAGKDASDAFLHPYIYLAKAGVEFES